MCDITSAALALDRLIELADGWHVVLDHDGAQWTLSITAKKGDSAHQYTSTDLVRIIDRAWAGAPGGRV